VLTLLVINFNSAKKIGNTPEYVADKNTVLAVFNV